jgi:hypothetical protein
VYALLFELAEGVDLLLLNKTFGHMNYLRLMGLGEDLPSKSFSSPSAPKYELQHGHTAIFFKLWSNFLDRIPLD